MQDNEKLYEAIAEGNLAMVKNYYFGNPALFDVPAVSHPFLTAAKHNRLDICAFLLEQGYDIDTDLMGVTNLVYAAQGGSLETVRWFIQHGAKVDGEQNTLYSPLHASIVGKHPEISAYLVEQGADVNHLHRVTYCTPLDNALRRKQEGTAPCFGHKAQRLLWSLCATVR